MRGRAAKGGRRNIIEVTSGTAAWSVYEWVQDLGEKVGAGSSIFFNGTKGQQYDESCFRRITLTKITATQ